MRSNEKSRRKPLGWRGMAKTTVLTLVVAATGCGMQPYEAPNNREIPAGPGILSGKDGEFVIYRDQKPVSEPPAESAEDDEDEKAGQAQ